MSGNSLKVSVSGLLLVSCLAGMAQEAPNWKIASGGAKIPFYALIPNGSGFLGVGSKGLIAGTRDGAAWAAYPSGTETDLKVLIQGGGLYVAAGDSGAIVTSSNGTAWAKPTTNYTRPFISAAYGNGAFVLLGNDKTVLVSGDGINWSAQTLPSVSDLRACAFGGGRFVVVGDFGAIYDSPDGKSWASRPKADFSMATIVHGDSGFVAKAAYFSYRSKDGLTWTKGGGFSGFSALSYADKRYFCPGDFGVIYSSTDGSTWSKDTTGTIGVLYCLTSSGGKVMGSGSETTLSPDGKTWITRKVSVPGGMLSVAYGNGRYVAVGNRSMAISADGSIWSTAVGADYSYTKIIFANGRFIAVGDRNAISTSVNGDNWTVVQNRVPNFSFSDIALGASGFIAIGSSYNTISRSSAYGSKDGDAWTLLATNMALVGNLAFGADKFVAVGYYGSLFSSVDGVKWNNHDLPGFTKWLHSVAYGGGKFVAVGDKGGILSSPDGLFWTDRTTDTTVSFNSVAYNGHQFIAIGSGNAMWLSNNGATWEKGASGVSTGIGIYYGGGRHIMVGTPEGIAFSDSVSSDGIRVIKPVGRAEPWEIRLVEGRLYVDLPEDFRASATEIRIVDAQGREMFTRSYPQGISAWVPVQSLPAGIYALEVRSGALHRNFSQTLILTHH